MEILIPGLILVALMAWASTKIKKRAADAFEAEDIETEDYFLRKPQGFLHVIGSSSHALEAYTQEFADEGNSQTRRAVIEIDILRNTSLADVEEAISKSAESVEVKTRGGSVVEITAAETANQTAVTAFYKIVGVAGDVIQLRCAVVTGHMNDYEERIATAIDSFSVRSN